MTLTRPHISAHSFLLRDKQEQRERSRNSQGLAWVATLWKDYCCLLGNTRDSMNPLFKPFRCLFWPQRRGTRGQDSSSTRNNRYRHSPKVHFDWAVQYFHPHWVLFEVLPNIPFFNHSIFTIENILKCFHKNLKNGLDFIIDSEMF